MLTANFWLTCEDTVLRRKIFISLNIYKIGGAKNERKNDNVHIRGVISSITDDYYNEC